MSMEMQTAIQDLSENFDKFMKKSERELAELRRNGFPMSVSSMSTQHLEFADFIRFGDLSKKSLNEHKDEEGGYLIPSEISRKIDERLMLLSPMRSISNVVKISSNNLDVLVNSEKADAGWGGTDDEERLETDAPQMKKIKIPVHELYAKPKVSQKLLDDTEINVEDWLINKISEKFAVVENVAFVNGDGTSKPTGFLHYASEDKVQREFGKLQHFKTGQNGKFSSPDAAVNLLIEISCSLKPMYVRNAKWLMSRSALAEIRKLQNKDGMCLWQPSISEATPPTLLGYPVIIDDDMPELKEGAGSTSVAFGDFLSGYQIVDRQNLKILRDPYTSKPFIEFYASKRVGGAVVDFDAIKLLKFEA